MKGKLTSAYMDFSKAFDVVPHCRLLNKLQFCCMNEVTCNWFWHFLAERCQKIMFDGVFSNEKSVDSGVPQGTVLGLLLFNLSIKDISNNLSAGTTIHLIADDCLVYRSIRSIEDQMLHG